MVRNNVSWLRSHRYTPAIIALAISMVAVIALASQTREAVAGGTGGRSGITEECNEKRCEVRMAGLTFTPDTLKIRPGATVTWTNADKVPHTVTSGFVKDGQVSQFDSGVASPIKGGVQWDWTFDADSPGAFRYYCAFHPMMTGQIVVTGDPIEEFPRLALMVLAGVGIFGVFGLVAAIYRRKR